MGSSHKQPEFSSSVNPFKSKLWPMLNSNSVKRGHLRSILGYLVKSGGSM